MQKIVLKDAPKLRLVDGKLTHTVDVEFLEIVSKRHAFVQV